MISREEACRAYNVLLDLKPHQENDDLRCFLCSLLIKAAENIDELHTAFMSANLITNQKKRNTIWRDAILRGEDFKKGNWTEDLEGVNQLCEMDSIHKNRAHRPGMLFWY